MMGSVTANITKFMARFGVNIGFLIWSTWIIASFAMSEKPISRVEILELIYYCALGLWFLQNILEEIAKLAREKRTT